MTPEQSAAFIASWLPIDEADAVPQAVAPRAWGECSRRGEDCYVGEMGEACHRGVGRATVQDRFTE